MKPSRVLVVDDSVVARHLLAEALTRDTAIEVAGVAANGSIALARIEQLQPDIVTLDLEMPIMDGLSTLRALRKRHRQLPVVIYSSQTERMAKIALDALALGANELVAKPSTIGSQSEALDAIQAGLAPTIKALCGPTPQPTQLKLDPTRKLVALASQPIEMIVIGVSTGGPNALAELIPALPQGLPPILIVQHMPPVFTRHLAERLSKRSAIPVCEGKDGDTLTFNGIWIAPGGHHMAVEYRDGSARLVIHDGPLENSCRPAADVLFRSAVAAKGGAVLGLVLTGMGQDGYRGSEAIHSAGGQVIVQDEESSVIWGMPGFVAQAGLADAVLPLNQIAEAIVQRVGPADRQPIRTRQ